MPGPGLCYRHDGCVCSPRPPLAAYDALSPRSPTVSHQEPIDPMRWILLPALALVASLAPARAGRADYVLRFDETDYTVAAGGTVDLELILQATDDASIAALQDFGIVTAFNTVTFNINGNPDPAQVLSLADLFRNPAFDSGIPVLTPAVGTGTGTVQWDLAVLVNGPVKAAAGTDFVSLATYRFTAGASGITSVGTGFLFDDPIFTNFILGDTVPTVIDSEIGFSGSRIVVQGQPPVIPEPSSVLLAGLGVGLVVTAARRVRTSAAA